MSTKIKPQPTQPSKTSKKSPQRKVVQKVQKPNGKIGLAYAVPHCVRHYLEASINPFDTPEGACLPADLFPLPSYKRVIFTRGTMATGTTGFGFVCVYPIFSNDGVSISFSTSTSVGIATGLFSTYTNISTGSFTNGPYTGAQFTASTLSARTVAVGVRLRCTASMMNRGGSYVTYEQINHGSTQTAYSYNTLKSVQGAQTHGIPNLDDPDQWDVAVCSSGPCLPSELQFAQSATPLAALDYLVIGISSASPAMTFDFEVFHHVEYNGTITSKTPSHSSPVGFSSAVQAMKEETVTVGPVSPRAGKSILDRFAEVIQGEMPHIIEMGVGLGKMLAGNEGSGIMNVLEGGYSIIADSINPKAITGPKLTTLQQSILAPERPLVRMDRY